MNGLYNTTEDLRFIFDITTFCRKFDFTCFLSLKISRKINILYYIGIQFVTEKGNLGKL